MLRRHRAGELGEHRDVADPVLEAEARRGGADYLVKPFDPERLLTIIREKLGTTPPAISCPGAGGGGRRQA